MQTLFANIYESVKRSLSLDAGVQNAVERKGGLGYCDTTDLGKEMCCITIPQHLPCALRSYCAVYRTIESEYLCASQVDPSLRAVRKPKGAIKQLRDIRIKQAHATAG